nr:TPA_asm: ATP synthase F0 subunit 8 [Pseudomyrmex elongatus]
MPQMSPLLWVPLMLFNLLMLYILISSIHYACAPSHYIKKSSSSLVDKIEIINKWKFLF